MDIARAQRSVHEQRFGASAVGIAGLGEGREIGLDPRIMKAVPAQSAARPWAFLQAEPAEARLHDRATGQEPRHNVGLPVDRLQLLRTDHHAPAFGQNRLAPFVMGPQLIQKRAIVRQRFGMEFGITAGEPERIEIGQRVSCKR